MQRLRCGQADYLRCCRQRTVTINGNVVANLRQPAAWGSDAWMASYGRRTHIEGAFGNYKSPKTADLKRGWVFIVGMVKTSLMLAAVAVATNIRLLRRWAARTGDRVHALCAVDPVDHGFEERDADGNPDLALAQPVQANPTVQRNPRHHLRTARGPRPAGRSPSPGASEAHRMSDGGSVRRAAPKIIGPTKQRNPPNRRPRAPLQGVS